MGITSGWSLTPLPVIEEEKEYSHPLLFQVGHRAPSEWVEASSWVGRTHPFTPKAQWAGEAVILAKKGEYPPLCPGSCLNRWSPAGGAFGEGYKIYRTWGLAGGSRLLWDKALSSFLFAFWLPLLYGQLSHTPVIAANHSCPHAFPTMMDYLSVFLSYKPKERFLPLHCLLSSIWSK